MNLEEMTLDLVQTVDLNANLNDAFKALLHRFGKGNHTPNGESLNLEIEPFAGGRWFRDRGQGIQHLWGHVQVIKPPVLLELSGPMFMSYPALNHIEIKLEEAGSGTKVTLRHRAIGMISKEHREGITTGWDYMLEGLKADCEKAAASQA
jgi:hypothetical protein